MQYRQQIMRSSFRQFKIGCFVTNVCLSAGFNTEYCVYDLLHISLLKHHNSDFAVPILIHSVHECVFTRKVESYFYNMVYNMVLPANVPQHSNKLVCFVKHMAAVKYVSQD